MKKVTEELNLDKEKELKLLQASNEMMQNTIEQAKLRGKEKTIKRIEIARKDVVDQIKTINPAIDTEVPQMSKFDEIASRDSVETEMQDLFDILQEDTKEVISLGEDSVNDEEPVVIEPREESVKFEVNEDTATNFNNVDSNAQYDVVPLPSRGEGYRSKTGRIPVGFLTAYDENFLTSPNLYEDGLVIDFLLKHKIMNKDINVEDLLPGDVDAITLFLRATSYGADFPITVVDPETKETIETVVDLTTLKPKDFVLQGDENGFFDFTLPVSKAKVKFKYLSRREEQELQKLTKLETESTKASIVLKDAKQLSSIIRNEKTISGADKQKYVENLTSLMKWAEELASKKTTLGYNRVITNRLEFAIQSVNGNTDRKYISKFVKTMPALDSYKLRRYMKENEPGIDFSITIQRPENLGGGSFQSFLEWDDAVFLNIA